MEYLVVFATAAMIAVYAVIIARSLPELASPGANIGQAPFTEPALKTPSNSTRPG